MAQDSPTNIETARIDFFVAVNRLGWISAQARKVLLARHVLRCLGCLNSEREQRFSDYETRVLFIFRSMLEAMTPGASSETLYSAPYEPSGRPNVYYISRSRSHRLIALDTRVPTEPELVFLFGGGEVHDFSRRSIPSIQNADQMLAFEIEAATKGTNLSTKKVVDGRCIELAKRSLWQGLFDYGLVDLAEKFFSDRSQRVQKFGLSGMNGTKAFLMASRLIGNFSGG